MESIDPIMNALQMRNWYAAAALTLAFVIQIIRKNPDLPVLAKLKAMWNKTPDGYRFLWPTTIGAATAFAAAFQAGASLQAALLAAVGGALGIGVSSMGVAAFLKESPIPWDGGKGGTPKPPAAGPKPPTKGPHIVFPVLAALLFVTGCAGGTAPKAPSSLPPDDPCRVERITEFALQCSATCHLERPGDPNSCLDRCEQEIDERCGQ